MTQQLTELATGLEQDRSTLERELEEIDLLMRQASSEVERHEARRVQAEERVAALENDSNADPVAVNEAHAHLLLQSRRQIMMQGQVEVLQGKQRALQRYYEKLGELVPALGEAAGAPAQLTAGDGHGASNGASPTGSASSRDVMAAQEQMRREIARQMHDGPAQSIANIALQAQVVQQLVSRDPRQAEAELRELVIMVQGALEKTKTFIFDVRPMVLDDLGLVPTLRRAAAERTRRTGQSVAFESVGADSRLGSEIESALFRIVDDAVQALLDARPAELVIRLDWRDAGLTATVAGRPQGSPAAADAAKAVVAAARRDKQMPAALASMIHEQESVESRGLDDRTWAEIRARAEPVGIVVSLSNDGWLLEAKVASRR
jgi:two-component system, NarL family, sensor histidine kinase DegS